MRPDSHKYLRSLALVGNGLFILWILYNAIDDGFQNPGSVESIALSGLVCLLLLNSFVLYEKK